MKKGEYIEVFNDDNYAATSFYYTEDTRDFTEFGRLSNSTVSIIFQLDLATLYGTNKRYDEEAHRDVILAIQKTRTGEITTLETGIENVYSEFDTTQIQYDDMQPFHVFRIDFEVPYEYDCCDDCSYENLSGDDIIIF